MQWLSDIDWVSGGWITTAIHCYAATVFILTLVVLIVHRSRLQDLSRRLTNIAGRIEGNRTQPTEIRLDEMTSVLLQLGDTIKRESDVEIAAVVDFLRQEERQRGLGIVASLVNVTETMIELFPMLGILGTVWAMSGIGAEDFSSNRLLVLFGTAIGTTLWALAYVIVFRIGYSAFVQGKVVALHEYSVRFHEFLSVLEMRSRAVESGVAQASGSWRESG